MNNNQNYIEASCVRLNAEDLLSQLADSVKVEVTGRHLVYKFDPLKETAVGHCTFI